MEKQREIFAQIKAWLEHQDYQADLVEQEDTPMLRALLPVLEEGKGLVLVEIFMTEYNQAADLVHIFATMTPPLGQQADSIQQAANGWNLEALAGCYGVCEKTEQLYYRHTVAIDPEAEAEDAAQDAFRGLCITLDEIARRLPEAIMLADLS